MAFVQNDLIEAQFEFDGVTQWYVHTAASEYYYLVKTSAEVGQSNADTIQMSKTTVDNYFKLIS